LLSRNLWSIGAISTEQYSNLEAFLKASTDITKRKGILTMKSAALSKFIGAGVLSLSLAALPLTLPASAQTETGTTGTSGADTTSTYNNSNTAAEGDRDFDWGWLGLLGLIGLAGLTKKSHEEPTRYREPEEVSRTGTRY
jgi:hypothetical protein